MSQPPHSRRILIVEDDADMRRLLASFLRLEGYDPVSAGDVAGMHTNLRDATFDLIILDVVLPDQDGFSALASLRAKSDIPVIFISGKGELIDRVLGLELGADDYLSKPFELRELLARIRSVLRRVRPRQPDQEQQWTATPLEEPPRQTLGSVQVDLESHVVHGADGSAVPLTGIEAKILQAFIDHRGRVLSRDQLLDLAAGRECAPFDRTIDVHVGRLRRKLGDTGRSPQLIKTVRGEGYILKRAGA